MQTTSPSAIPQCEVRVVHLPRAVARRALMQAELDRTGISANDWSAVDGGDPANASRMAAMPDQGPWGPMEPHAKGCLASHLDALGAFIKGPASHLLMLEDDVFLADDLALWLEGDYWPPGANLLKLERWRDDRLKLLVDRSSQRHAGREVRRLRSRHSGGAGYIIDRKGAEIVLNARILDLPVDHLLFNPYVSKVANILQTYQVFPALITQGNEPKRAAKPPSPAKPKRQKSLSHKLQRLAGELQIVRQIPRLLSGQSFLTSITWRANAGSLPDTQEKSKG
jgi:glycosyl transferase family 25